MSTRASIVAPWTDCFNLCWTCLLANNGRTTANLHPLRRTRAQLVQGRGANRIDRIASLRSISTTTRLDKRHTNFDHLTLQRQRAIRRNYHGTARLNESASPGQRRRGPRQARIEPIPETPQSTLSIRERLKLWEQEHPQDLSTSFAFPNDTPKPWDIQNVLSRSSENSAPEDGEEASDGPASSLATMRDGETVDVDINEIFLKPGDLVELRSGTETTLAILTQEFDTELQFYTMQGKWLQRPNRNIHFSQPDFVSMDVVEQLLQYLPNAAVAEEIRDKAMMLDANVPREVGAPAVRAMLSFWNQADKVYRKHASVLEEAHNLLSHETNSRVTTTRDVAAKLLGDETPSQPTLYAVHRTLRANEYGFGHDVRNHRVTGEFRIRPKSEVRLVNTVREWIRQFQEQIVAATTSDDITRATISQRSPVHGFVAKARKLVAQSRNMRIPREHGVGPRMLGRDDKDTDSTQRDRCVFSIEFSEQEQMIIRFLEAWCVSRSFANHSSLQSIGPMLIRAVGSYQGFDIDPGTGFLFLQEIGVLAPWENRIVFDPQLGLPGHGNSEQADRLAYQSLRTRSLRARDAMQGLRKDWGSMEVYCIDDAGAKEIDDGFSVESVPGTESQYWIHTHIANPSAFITPSSTIGQYAEVLSQTVYFPERTYPMLPPQVTAANFSLAPGRPTLTFSARVDEGGEILETKITSGTVQNVTFITPDKLRQVLDNDTAAQQPPETILTVGGQMPPPSREGLDKELTASQIHELKLLQALGQARRDLRKKRGLIALNIPRPGVTVLNNQFNRFFRNPSLRQSRFFEEDPIIEYRAKHFTLTEQPDCTKMVEDIMQLACEAAGQWCSDRNVPMPYRCTVAHPDRQDPADFLQNVLPLLADEAGNVPLGAGLQYVKLLRAIVSTTPAPHMLLGAKRYVKVTSPLRRFGDLLSHWQIESALRYEARGHSLMNNDVDPFHLAYSKLELDWRLPRIGTREKMLSRAERNADRHWAIQLLYRCFYAQEADLPETFEFYVYSKGAAAWAGHVSGFIKTLGIDVDMIAAGIGQNANVGDWWEVRIRDVDPYLRRVDVEPVRLIKSAT
ncbi:RNB-domain-containing protein [Xylona heveae TC161]|uniref:RNB-domain-containing protein n=1 Tax=Xylona heveae (strain CBS 132557 / TC161) TaxID=1328760 RepID=A0A165JWH9_XYLHT|nr:RNB-domain-containing protein [Xylona heveae TC161]KZF26710.1 RNB-domain-containing protein [Xylona heveae TC161]